MDGRPQQQRAVSSDVQAIQGSATRGSTPWWYPSSADMLMPQLQRMCSTRQSSSKEIVPVSAVNSTPCGPAGPRASCTASACCIASSASRARASRAPNTASETTPAAGGARRASRPHLRVLRARRHGFAVGVCGSSAASRKAPGACYTRTARLLYSHGALKRGARRLWRGQGSAGAQPSAPRGPREGATALGAPRRAAGVRLPNVPVRRRDELGSARGKCDERLCFLLGGRSRRGSP